MSSDQMMMINIEELVSLDHQYHKFKILFDFKAVEEELLAVESGCNYKGYGILRLFKCLLLQFMEDLSDGELERYLDDSTAAKWFCDFALTENYGISFGFMRDYYQYSNAVFLITNTVIVCYLYYLMMSSKTIVGFVDYSFVIGGAIGNLIDRFFRGAVFDFIHFHYQDYRFPVFNLADCFITTGVIILLEDYYSKKYIEEKDKENYDKARIEAMAEKIRNSDKI